MPLTGRNDNPKKKGQTTMNYYGILTNYEERMEANLEQYSRPEKAGTFHLRLDYRTWGKRMCLFCYFTDEDTGEKIRLACWRNAKEHYAPRKCTDIDFARVPTNSLWRCTLEADARGNINWVMAEKTY